MTGEGRLIAVLGYSDGTSESCHPISAGRVARAAEEVRPEDSVLLSGAARRGGRASEARLMSEIWTAPAARVVLDESARTTFGNAAGAASVARDLGLREVVLVTSGWHARRATALFRAALPAGGVTLVSAPTNERGTRRARLREIVCWLVVPLQVLALRRNRGGAPRAKPC